MKLQSNIWLKDWQSFNKEPAPKINRRDRRLHEASEGFMANTKRWIATMTQNGDVPLEQVLPWGDLFGDNLRVVISAENEDDTNLKRISLALLADNWMLPAVLRPDGHREQGKRGFSTEKVKQVKRRLGTGEEYDVEEEVARLNVEKTTTKTIPKGPRAGEEVKKTETTSMSKAINKSKNIPDDLKKWWEKKQTFYVKAGNWKQLETFMHEPEEGQDLSSSVIIISRDPNDVLRMGDMELEKNMGRIGHCHEEGGAYEQCAIQEAEGHGPIAYLVSKKQLDDFLTDAPYGTDADVADTITKKEIWDFDGQEIFNDADRNIKGIKVINRLRLRQFVDSNTDDTWAVPSLRVYPPALKVPGWRQAVEKWAWDKQKHMYEDNYEEGEFPAFGDWVRFGGTWTDSNDYDGPVLNKFFSQSGEDPDYENTNVFNQTEEDAEPPLWEEWSEQIDETISVYNQRYDHSHIWGEVEEGEEPDAPYLHFNGSMTVEFPMDHMGEEGGAEYELPLNNEASWQMMSQFQKEIQEGFLARDIYIYFEDMQVQEYGPVYQGDTRNKVHFMFDITRDDFDPTPNGLDAFAEHVESDWDNDYDSIRNAIRRVLIDEEYMTPLPSDKLRKQAEEEEITYKYWDIDVEPDHISIHLKPGKEKKVWQKGLFLGQIPKGLDLRRVFSDWTGTTSWEFNKVFVPKMRTLFAAAEKDALRQLTLPGIEPKTSKGPFTNIGKKMHQLLVPSRVAWRLNQHFDDYDKPADIYLNIQLDVYEDLSEEEMEGIELFVEYLDNRESLDLIRTAAKETFRESFGPAKERHQRETDITDMKEELKEKLMGLPLQTVVTFGRALQIPDQFAREIRDSVTNMAGGENALEELTSEIVETRIKALDAHIDRINRGDPGPVGYYADDPKTGESVYTPAEEGPEWFLPQSTRGYARTLWLNVRDLIIHLVNKLTDIAMTYTGERYHKIGPHTRLSDEDLANEVTFPAWWYTLMLKYKFTEASQKKTAFERRRDASQTRRARFEDEILASLHQVQKEKAPQQKLPIKEAYNLLDRIDSKLNESKKKRKIRIRVKRK